MTSEGGLTAADARMIMHARREPERIALGKVVQQCERAVRLAATRDEIDTLFNVPLFLTDVPVYRLQRMVEDLVAHMRARGFVARQVEPGGPLVYINWAPLPPAPTGRHRRA